MSQHTYQQTFVDVKQQTKSENWMTRNERKMANGKI